MAKNTKILPKDFKCLPMTFENSLISILFENSLEVIQGPSSPGMIIVSSSCLKIFKKGVIKFCAIIQKKFLHGKHFYKSNNIIAKFSLCGFSEFVQYFHKHSFFVQFMFR